MGTPQNDAIGKLPTDITVNAALVRPGSGSVATTPDSHRFQRQVAHRQLDDLRPHPSYIRHHLTVSTAQLSALANQGDLAFREPLVITRDCTILDGYARVELARLQGLRTLPCVEYELNEAEALHSLLQMHLRSSGLIAFTRIMLALDLEPWLREKARSHQQSGGQNKGSSKLTEAEKLDVRTQIAAAAGVSVGNVTKVKQLTANAPPELLQALRNREISIHRAWKWSKETRTKQREELMSFISQRGMKKIIRALVARHRPTSSGTLDVGTLLGRLSGWDASQLASVKVSVIKISGKTLFVTDELIQACVLENA
jgi:hypothetical protein